MIEGITPDALVPVGKILLSGGFGASLIRAMRGQVDVQDCFEGLVIGYLTLCFGATFASTLNSLSNDLSEFVRHLGDKDDLRRLILDAFKTAADSPDSTGKPTAFNIPAVLTQAWRTGLWGVLSLAVDWVFLLSSFLLKSAHEVFWQILLFLLPLAAGAFPVFPRILTNVAFYALELSLWFPMLALVEIITALVARRAMANAESIGLYLVAVELVTIFLTFKIPSFTHRFLNGALSGDHDSSSGIIRLGKVAAAAVTPFL